MEIRDSADIYEDSGLKPLIYEMDISKYFIHKDYGNNEVKLFFVINCLRVEESPSKGRYTTKDKVLYWDIKLDYELVKQSPVKEKKMILANAIVSSFDVLDKYKKLHLNKEAIKADATKYFMELGWL